jgi:hypothetical protein
MNKQRVYAILTVILVILAIWGLVDSFLVDLGFSWGLGGICAMLILFLTLLQRENDKKAED